MNLISKIAIGASALVNILVISLLVYTHLSYDKRVEKNREFLRGILKEEVTKQIIQAIPHKTGEVKR